MNLWVVRGEAYRKSTLIANDSIDSRAVNDLLEMLAGCDIRTFLYDQTADTGIATVIAFLVDLRAAPETPLSVVSSAGAHASSEIAVLRAITEAAQTRITLIAGARDDLRWSAYSDSQKRHALIRWLNTCSPGRALPDLPDFGSPTAAADLEQTLERLAPVIRQTEAASGVTVAELTPPDYPVSVVKAVIPALEQPFYTSGLPAGERFRNRLRRLAARGASSC